MHQIKAGKKELHIVDDKLGTPTYTLDFAKNVSYYLKNNIGVCTTWFVKASRED